MCQARVRRWVCPPAADFRELQRERPSTEESGFQLWKQTIVTEGHVQRIMWVHKWDHTFLGQPTLYVFTQSQETECLLCFNNWPCGKFKTSPMRGCKCASILRIRDCFEDQYSLQCLSSDAYFLIFMFSSFQLVVRIVFGKPNWDVYCLFLFFFQKNNCFW